MAPWTKHPRRKILHRKAERRASSFSQVTVGSPGAAERCRKFLQAAGHALRKNSGLRPDLEARAAGSSIQHESCDRRRMAAVRRRKPWSFCYHFHDMHRRSLKRNAPLILLKKSNHSYLTSQLI